MNELMKGPNKNLFQKMQGIAVIGVEKYKNLSGGEYLQTLAPPTIKCDTTPKFLLPTNHLS
jgi:hypothetical protein